MELTDSYLKYRNLMQRGAYAEAAILAETEVELSQSHDAFWLTRYAVAQIRAKRINEARTAAEEALKIAPTDSWALAALAETYLAEGHYELAITGYRESLKSSHQIGIARRGILRCLAGLEKWPELLQELNQFTLDEESSLHWKLKAFMGLKQYDQATEICERLLELSPHQKNALWELSKIEVAKHGIETTMTSFSRLAKIPSNPTIYREIYASLCKQAGEVTQALQEYKKLTTSSSNPRFARKQVFILAKSGHELEAIPQMEEFLRMDLKDFYMHSAYIAACKRVNKQTEATLFYQQLLCIHPEQKSIYGYLHRLSK